MFDRKVLKSRAKFVLARAYFPSFIACLIVSVISGGGIGVSTQRLQNLNFETMSYMRIMAIFAVIAGLSLIAIAFMIFLTAPLKVGLKKFMLDSSAGDTKLENILFPFRNNYKNVVLTQFMKNLFIFLWSLLGLIPLVIGIWKFDLANRIFRLANLVANDSIQAAMSLILLMSVLLLLTLVFTVPAIIKELQYALTEYILADNPSTPWKTVLDRSKEMMVGNKWGLVKLVFSFAGWYIAASLFCCIGNFLLAPYVQATLAEMYLDLCGRGKDNTYPGFGF